MKIYNELKSLGFLEWLNDIKFGCSHTNIMLLDVQPIDSIERSGYNAIAFRWFREKYGLYHSIGLDNSLENNVNCDYVIINHSQSISELETNFKSYEEAELECLKKLIEIVKQK